jgi:CRP/FNR family transcriptional regulator, anaerobic regulatory protein
MRNVSAQNVSSARPRGNCAGCGFVSWCLPADLNPAELAQIEQLTEHRRAVKRDLHLFHAGDALHSLYVVNSGSVKTSMPDEDGRAQLIGFSLPGDIIGLEAIGSGKYPSDVIALEDTSCCGIHYGDLARLSQSIPALQHHLHRVMSREITRDYDLMFMLGSMSAEERLAAFLLNLSERYSARGYSALHFRLSMTRQDIGSYLGLKLETISRLLTRLADEQIVEVHGRDIAIKNLEGLQQIIGSAGQRMPWPRKHATNTP